MSSASTHTGLIGWPVAHSLSPVIHNYWRAQHGIAGDYQLFPIAPQAMDADIKKLKLSGLRGFNVTVPHKETILPYLDVVDDVARHIGAVNTVVRDGATWRGTNTDAYGFITHLTHALPAVSLARCVILGAGGAARAAVVALKHAGASEILLTNRTKPTADALAAEFSIKTTAWEARHEALAGASLLVNTTSLGMTGKPPLDIDVGALPPHAAVYDIVYAPRETALLAAAKARSLPTVDGLGMLLYQAQRAFEEWHGVLPTVDAALIAVVEAEIARRAGP